MQLASVLPTILDKASGLAKFRNLEIRPCVTCAAGRVPVEHPVICESVQEQKDSEKFVEAKEICRSRSIVAALSKPSLKLLVFAHKKDETLTVLFEL
jgi:hypothetical protein